LCYLLLQGVCREPMKSFPFGKLFLFSAYYLFGLGNYNY
jgi:hypothetical protein